MGTVLRLPASLLARQSPAVRAALARAQNRGALVTSDVTRDGDVVVITLTGVKMPSLSNIGPRQQIAAKGAQSAALRPILAEIACPLLPLDIEILRIAPKLVDVKNLDITAKRVIDDLARWTGVDDAVDTVVRYTVRQEIGHGAVRITIRPRG